MKPLIAIAGIFTEARATSVWKYREYFVNEAYTSRLEDAGAIPYILPGLKEDNIEEQIAPFSALLIPGGKDFNPACYHELKKECTQCPFRELDNYQLALIKKAYQLGKWVFGICRGFQGINIAFGGSLYQDLSTERTGSLCHLRTDSPYQAVHTVSLQEGSHLHKMFGTTKIGVNSLHHQGIKNLGKGLVASAFSEDGIIEGIEAERILAVQWHPEALSGDFFSYIVSLAKG